MKVLRDTHIALWTLLDSEKLPIEARNLINQENVEPVFSLISMWEIAIKHAIHPNKMPISGAQFLDYCSPAVGVRGRRREIPAFAGMTFG